MTTVVFCLGSVILAGVLMTSKIHAPQLDTTFITTHTRSVAALRGWRGAGAGAGGGGDGRVGGAGRRPGEPLCVLVVDVLSELGVVDGAVCLLTYHYHSFLFPPAAFREAHARLKAMVEEAELRRKQARAVQQQQPGQQGPWMGGGAPEQLMGASESRAYTEEDRLMRSLLRRACPLVRRKGKILHELQVPTDAPITSRLCVVYSRDRRPDGWAPP